jgi:transcriptional accessory protein Tex/SPT6
MSIDIEQLARTVQCDSGHLRTAVMLLRQGYRPSYLARYRRDELGGLNESVLWVADLAVRSEERIERRRAELQRRAAAADPARPCVEALLADSVNEFELDLAARVLKSPALDATDAHRLAKRLLRPLAGDSADPVQVVHQALGTDDPLRVQSALAGWQDALPDLFHYDLRILRAASQWLERNAKIQIGEIIEPQREDPHDEVEADSASNEHTTDEPHLEDVHPVSPDDSNVAQVANVQVLDQSHPVTPESSPPEQTQPDIAGSPEAQSVSKETSSGHEATLQAEPTIGSPTDATERNQPGKRRRGRGKGKGKGKGKEEHAEGPTKGDDLRRLSPRQRRRKWLVSVLTPLASKSLPPHRLTGFQKLMLLRGERSSLTHPRLVYDRQSLIRHLQKVVGSFHSGFSTTLRETLEAMADPLLDAAEKFFWEEQLHRVRQRLVMVVSERFRRDNLRPPITANRVLAIDAVGPKSVAVAVVSRSGNVLHTEDLPCQLAGPFRQQMVTRLGELIHRFRADFLVVSNGPARRAALTALRDLFSQSQPGTLRWTLVDRSGADLYASSPTADRTMRQLPRRFRAANWLALHLLKPLDAVSELDPTRLRLSSYQRELPKNELRDALSDLLTAAMAGRGADVNGDSTSLLAKMPGLSPEMVERIDHARRDQLLSSREALAQLDGWNDVSRRQALPFLRVYNSSQKLDGTAIHPDDYHLAAKLISALAIPESPAAPPGYQAPLYKKPVAHVAEENSLAVPSGETVEQQPAQVAGESKTEPEVAAVASLGETSDDSSLDQAQSEPTPETSSTSIQTDGPLQPHLQGFGEANVVVDVSKPSPPPIVDEPEPEVIRHSLPVEEKVRKVIKEWQVGPYRVRKIVGWLCEPFSPDRTEGQPAFSMESVPQLMDLKPGQAVVGVVVGVTPFGAFVEIAPDCNGMIHISRLTESYLEDPHEAVQVGDVVNAHVLEVDLKRRRVALSCISPERQRILDEQLQQRRDRGSHGHAGESFARGHRREDNQHRGGQGSRNEGQRSGQRPDEQRRGNQGGGDRGGQRSGQHDRGQQPGRGFGQQQRRDHSSRGGQGQGQDRTHRRHEGHGPPSGDQPRKSGERKPFTGESKPKSITRVERPQPATPITDGMKSGAEPLRSFSDLMQFYRQKDPPADPESRATITESVSESTATSPESTSQDAPATTPANEESGASASESHTHDETHQP